MADVPVVSSVAQLRELVSRAGPGAHLVFQIEPSTPLEQAKLLWEAVSLQGGHAELANPEVLRSKQLASDFVESKIQELMSWRQRCSGLIGGMNKWLQVMGQRLEHGPDLPPDHCAWIMMGPELYLDINKIGTVQNAGQHRESILDQFYDMPVNIQVEDPEHEDDDGEDGENPGFWSPTAVRNRELDAVHSLTDFNVTCLEIKIKSLEVLKTHITKGIRALQRMKKERSFLGCGTADFDSFWNIPMAPV